MVKVSKLLKSMVPLYYKFKTPIEKKYI